MKMQEVNTMKENEAPNDQPKPTKDYIIEEEPEVGMVYMVALAGGISTAAQLVYIDNESKFNNKYLFVAKTFDEDKGVYWLHKAAIELRTKVDWSKVPVDTKISAEGIGMRYFAGYGKGDVFFFSYGATSWSSSGTYYAKEDKVTLA